MHVVVAPDKFRGTASATQVAAAIEEAVIASNGTAVTLPMADGGEGTLEALGGQNQTSLVTGPLGDLVEAPWRLSGSTAVIEMAQASIISFISNTFDSTSPEPNL